MQFEALQARYGDCLVLTLPGTDRPIRLLVDGGPAGVFRTSLKPRLDREAAQFKNEKPLAIDAVMVSHIDEDHILGVLDLFGVLLDADQKHAPRPYHPTWLLHNSFDALVGEGEGGTARALGGETVLASIDAALDAAATARSETARLVLQSYGQGSKLASLSAALKIGRNPPDQSVLGFHANKPRVLKLGEATLTVVGPLQEDIDNFQQGWRDWKSKQKDTASLAAYLDESVPNLSSIVVLLESGGNRVLLTGDARGDHIMQGLEGAGFMATRGTIDIDICKVPHHGSARDLDVDFFQRIRAKHYVASGDGTYGNPDRETLEMIEKARPEGGFTFHMTYSAEECDAGHKAWRANRKGPPFDQDRDGITQIITNWKHGGKIAVEEGPIQISL